jgi:hypothetical protein
VLLFSTLQADNGTKEEVVGKEGEEEEEEEEEVSLCPLIQQQQQRPSPSKSSNYYTGLERRSITK